METRDIDLKKGSAVGMAIPMPKANLVLAVAKRGFVMCGYLDLAAAEKLKDAAAVVTGVKSVDELLDGSVKKVTSAAARRGIRVGMTGRQALEKLV